MSPRIYKSPFPPVHLPETSVFELAFSNPSRRPDSHVCLVDGTTGEEVTRKQLKSESQKLASGLRNNLNLQPGEIVCIFSPNSIFYHKLVFAIQCAGMVVSAANAHYTSSELVHQLGDSGSKIIFVHPEGLEVAEEAVKQLKWENAKERVILAVRRGEEGENARRKGYKTLDEVVGTNPQELKPFQVNDPKDRVAYLGYSSGTTGAAKGVMTTHYNMTSVISILAPLEFGKNDVHLAILPFNHIYGLTKLIHWPIYQGARVVIMPRFEIKQFCSLVQKYQVSACLLVPPVALLLAKDPTVDQYDLSSLRLLLSGAAPMGSSLEDKLMERLRGTKITQAYGLTETSPTTHYCPTYKPASGSIGFLLPNLEGRIVSPESGKDVNEGEVGELWLKGPNVMKGYLNRPEANKETIVEGGWLRTGDIAMVKGDHFYITDRIKELIKYKGFQVPPAELEALLISHPKINDAACIGVYSEEEVTEIPRAYIVPAEKISDPKAFSKEIQDWVASKVANHKKLRGGVFIVDAVPKSPSGKILRRVLKDQVKAEQAKQSQSKAKL